MLKVGTLKCFTSKNKNRSIPTSFGQGTAVIQDDYGGGNAASSVAFVLRRAIYLTQTQTVRQNMQFQQNQNSQVTKNIGNFKNLVVALYGQNASDLLNSSGVKSSLSMIISRAMYRYLFALARVEMLVELRE